MGKFLSQIREIKRDDKERRFAAWPSTYKGPLIVAEGDSWFEYPWQNDTIMVLSQRYRIKPLARAGDTWADVIHENELEPTVEALNPDIVLLSVGGNDIVDNIPMFVRRYSPNLARTAKAYIIQTVFKAALDLVFGKYDLACRPIVDKGIDVIVSGYDHPNPRTVENGGQWLGPELLRTRNLYDIPLWHWIVRELIDTYDRRMRDFVAGFNAATDPKATSARLTFVSQIGVVNKTPYDPASGEKNPDWNDEMHPHDAGFARLADNLGAAIEVVWKRRNSAIV